MAKRAGPQSDQPFIKRYRELTYRWTPWQDFVTMFACSISNAVEKLHFDDREAMYLKRIQSKTSSVKSLWSSAMTPAASSLLRTTSAR